MQDHCFAFGEGLVTALEKASHGKRRLGWLGFGSCRALSAHQIFVAFCVIFCVAVTKMSVNMTWRRKWVLGGSVCGCLVTRTWAENHGSGYLLLMVEGVLHVVTARSRWCPPQVSRILT